MLTDSHAHLSSVAEELGVESLESLLADYAEDARRAEEEGRTPPLLLDPGTEPDDLRPRLALLGGAAGLPSFLRLAAGVWPSASSLADPAASLADLEAAIAEAGAAGLRLAAIGEGGPDYHHMEAPRERQLELFEGQLALAARLGLPMIVHSRDAAADTIGCLRSRGPSTPVLIHCFGYGPEEARAFLELGCLISFAGNLSYKKSEALREACRLVPADRLLLETDAPYMNPMPFRGRPSSPRDVGRSYALAAQIRGVEEADLAETVSRNARALFG
jgi:TatD DNase family protein